MSTPVQIGATTVLEADGYEFDPFYGSVRVLRYRGNDSDIDSLAFQFRGARNRITKERDVRSGNSTLVVRVGGEVLFGDDLYSEVWNGGTDYTYETLYENPEIAAILDNNAGYLEDVVAAVTGGDDMPQLPLTPAEQAKWQKVYDELLRGRYRVETPRFTITRIRTYAFGSITPYRAPRNKQAWTRAAFISTFSVPQETQNILPLTPATAAPQSQSYAYALTGYQSNQDYATNRTIEELTWTFHHWNTLEYEIDP